MLPVINEGQRLLTICNSCRYCEGYCAVFPAMERRMTFTPADVRYLANLCHNCAECYYACQYAPPHEFAVNVPKMFAEVREQSYEKYAWPHGLWRMLHGWRSLTVWAVAAAVVMVVMLGARPNQEAGFYSIIPHTQMVNLFLAAALWVVLGMAAGLARCWRDGRSSVNLAALLQGLRDAFTLKNLQIGGVGCTYPDENHSNARRWFHHCTFYGFLLCFASTTVAAAYHYILNQPGPHPYTSLPVVLGTLGGAGLLAGPAGLWLLKRRRDTRIVDPKQDGMDVSFLASLFLVSLTGLLLLLLRGTPSMPALLLIHLALVLGLFLTLPYGKFVHGIYRTAALVRNAVERS